MAPCWVLIAGSGCRSWRWARLLVAGRRRLLVAGRRRGCATDARVLDPCSHSAGPRLVP